MANFDTYKDDVHNNERAKVDERSFLFGLHLFRRLDGFLGGDVCLTVAYVGILW